MYVVMFQNDLSDLCALTAKWRGIVQEVILDLHSSLACDPRPSLEEFINYLHLDHSQIGYDAEKQQFV